MVEQLMPSNSQLAAYAAFTAHMNSQQTDVENALRTLNRDELWALKHVLEDLANTVEAAFRERPEQ